MRGLPIPSLLNASGLNPFRARVRVPLRLGAVTTIGAETSAGEVGLRRGAIATVWRAVEALYRTGLHPAISLVVRRRGEVVLNRAIGHRLLGGDELMTPDTPACLFSCSKAITAVVLHKLALDDKVATYLPEFAANGKQDVTLRALLTHRAGLAKLPFDDPDPMLLFKIDTMLEALCAAPLSGAARQGYHAVTSGYILGAVAERASDRPLPELLAELLRPLGCADTVTYGVSPERRDEVALSYWTGPQRLPPLTGLMTRLLGLAPHVIAPAMNTPTAMSRVLPAAGLYASAADASRIFQMLLDGGSWNGKQILRRHRCRSRAPGRPAGDRRNAAGAHPVLRRVHARRAGRQPVRRPHATGIRAPRFHRDPLLGRSGARHFGRSAGHREGGGTGGVRGDGGGGCRHQRCHLRAGAK